MGMRDEVIVNTDDKIFVSALVKKLKEKTACEVKVQKITKNNNLVLTGLCIMQKDCNIAPTIYLEYYKDLYEDGSMDMEEIVDHIIQRDQEHRINGMDVSFFTDFEKVKKDLSFKVINAERNIKLLEKVPHKRFLDLAKVYYVTVSNEAIGEGSIQINNNHMQMWGITEEELDRIASAMGEENQKACFIDMVSMVEEILQDKEEDSLEMIKDIEGIEPIMYVATNRKRFLGAAVMIYKTFLEKVAEKLKNNLIIFPSSVHEILIVAESPAIDIYHCKKMVKDVNATQVEPDEFLSDNVYYYDRKTKELIIAD